MNPSPKKKTKMELGCKTRSKIELWKHTKVLLQDLDDSNMQSELEFFLYQKHLGIEEMQILHGLVIYLLEKQSFEKKMHGNLDRLTKDFRQFVMET